MYSSCTSNTTGVEGGTAGLEGQAGAGQDADSGKAQQVQCRPDAQTAGNVYRPHPPARCIRTSELPACHPCRVCNPSKFLG